MLSECDSSAFCVIFSSLYLQYSSFLFITSILLSDSFDFECLFLGFHLRHSQFFVFPKLISVIVLHVVGNLLLFLSRNPIKFCGFFFNFRKSKYPFQLSKFKVELIWGLNWWYGVFKMEDLLYVGYCGFDVNFHCSDLLWRY